MARHEAAENRPPPAVFAALARDFGTDVPQPDHGGKRPGRAAAQSADGPAFNAGARRPAQAVGRPPVARAAQPGNRRTRTTARPGRRGTPAGAADRHRPHGREHGARTPRPSVAAAKTTALRNAPLRAPRLPTAAPRGGGKRRPGPPLLRPNVRWKFLFPGQIPRLFIAIYGERHYICNI